jgi:DNA-binding transcriptional LysR family regulator
MRFLPQPQRRLGKVQRVVCASPNYLARRSMPRTPGERVPRRAFVCAAVDREINTGEARRMNFFAVASTKFWSHE